jgi:hypothetical protein
MALGCGNPERDRTARHAEAAGGSVPAPLEVMEAPTVLLGLRGSEPEFRGCFVSDGALKSGFVKLRWEVTEEGTVEQVDVIGSSVGDELIERCLSERVSSMKFSGSTERVQARWTFVHRLPKLPGVGDFLEKRKKEKAKLAKKRKRKKSKADFQDDEDQVQGLTIEPSSEGSIEPQAIEDVVFTGYRLFAHCYRDGIERDASLGGIVRLRFVIDDVGDVAGVADSGSELPDQRVLDCMAEGIFALRFPAPREGDVKVVYRIVFDSG